MTQHLERGRGQHHAPAAIYHREKPSTHCTGSWVDQRSGLDRCLESRPQKVSIPGHSSPYLNRYTDWASRPTMPLYNTKIRGFQLFLKSRLICCYNFLSKWEVIFVFKLYTNSKLIFIFIAQKLYYQGHYTRYISLNVKYLDVHKKVRDKIQFAYLAMQV
jgi:hypothetical protein